MSVNGNLRELKNSCAGYWGERVYAELVYANELSKTKGNEFETLLEKASAELLSAAAQNGCISACDVKTCEAVLEPIVPACKELTVHAVGHAHIDMDWMWRYDETVDITLETFRTVLNLMNDFPDFTFAQSQASCYAIVERYDPDLLCRIKEKVKSGQWEVIASTWTETDKNMPSGESLSRHILYTKRYMSKIFDLPESALRLDFEPDTFGHNLNVPEICQAGGIEYYYHCRGNDENEIYNWRSPSGAELLVYREPAWYLGPVKPMMAELTPSFCSRNHVRDILKIYGVGDHGGGPTRRDLERLTDMAGWPVYPTVRFGTYHNYFDTIKKNRSEFPVVTHELNFIFDGCYTTQTRIKAANRIAEAALFESEALSAWASKLAGAKVNGDLYEQAWKNVLFNHFHDIIPGSCVIDSREYSMGLFQESLACANTQKAIAVYAIGDAVDTAVIGDSRGQSDTNSEGGGVGYKVEEHFNLSRVERGRGLRRGYLIFNMAPAGDNVVDLTLWDWRGDLSALSVKDASGGPLQFQLLDKGFHEYWQHEFTNIAVQCRLPAYGYALIVLDEDPDMRIPLSVQSDPRVAQVHKYDMENDRIKVCINPVDGSIDSVQDKQSGQYLAVRGRFECFAEDADGSAWVVGRYQNNEEQIKIKGMEWLQQGALRQSVRVRGVYKSSKIEYIYTLDSGSGHVSVDSTIDWLEAGNEINGIPQIHFVIEPFEQPHTYLYDIPFGTIRRESYDMDVPALSYASTQPESGPALAIFADTKYGRRCADGRMSLTLIRSSFGPDPYPELYRHHITFHIAVCGDAKPLTLSGLSKRLSHRPFTHSVPAHPGKLPAELSLVSVIEGSAVIEAVKLSEDGSGDLIIRLSDAGDGGGAVLELAAPVKQAGYCGLTESVGEQCMAAGNRIMPELRRNGVTTVRVTV